MTGPRTSTLTRRDGLLIVLTAGAASTDALSYLGLGQVFPANMTGNTVLLAIGVTTADYAKAIRSLLALGGFVFGAVVAGLAAGTRTTKLSDPALRASLLAEFAIQVAALGWWLTGPDHPNGAAQLTLIALLGVTMGMQSATVARLPVGVSTTYITGTWTAVSTWAASRMRRVSTATERSSDARIQGAVVVCYFAAALAAGYVFRAASGVAAAIPAGSTALVSLALCHGRHSGV